MENIRIYVHNANSFVYSLTNHETRHRGMEHTHFRFQTGNYVVPRLNIGPDFGENWGFHSSNTIEIYLYLLLIMY